MSTEGSKAELKVKPHRAHVARVKGARMADKASAAVEYTRFCITGSEGLVTLARSWALPHATHLDAVGRLLIKRLLRGT